MGPTETFPGVRVWLVVIAAGLPACAPVIRPTMTPPAAASHMAEFWEEPTDLEARDVLHGFWGVERAPDPNVTYTFLRKKRQGNNPGLTVTDPAGREWHVKQGTEAQPEVVLSHVLWALGYHQKRAHQDSERWYAVRDLGSSLGATGRFNPKENDPNLFERHGFITRVTDGYVEFGAINKALVQHRITPGDVQWAMGLLARLTDGQWADAFRGAGYERAVADRFIGRLRQKIAAAQRLGSATATSTLKRPPC